MATALLDQNGVPSAMAVLNTDTVQGTNLVRIKANPSNGGLKVNTTATISFTMVPVDERDQNYKTCMTFTGADGFIYPWVATSDGEVLISV